MRILAFLPFLFLSELFIVDVVFAQGGSAIANCLAIGDAGVRANCLSAVIEGMPEEKDPPVTEAAGGVSEDRLPQWTHEIGADGVRARTRSSLVSSQYLDAVELTIACRAGQLESALHWFIDLGSEGVSRHRYRFDKGEILEAANWPISSGGTVSVISNTNGVVEQLFGAGRFAVEVHPRGRSSSAALFELRNGRKEMAKVAEACGLAARLADSTADSNTPAPVSEVVAGELSVERSSYTPTRRWQYSGSVEAGHAYVLSQSQNSALVLECIAGREGFSLELQSPEGWIANEAAGILVDELAFETQLFGGEMDVSFSDDPSGGLLISDVLLESLLSGNRVELIGPATAQMPDGAKIFSLAGSSAAIRAMRGHCGL